MIRLKFERIHRGLSQAALAHLAGIPQPVICLIEAGKWNPGPDQLEALARALDVSATLLLKPCVMEEVYLAEGSGRR